MAVLRTTYLENMEQTLNRLEGAAKGELIVRLLNVGAEVLLAKWKNQITRHNHIRTGSMIQSVGIEGPFISENGGMMIVQPTGTDREHNITQATKAYMINSGRPATHRGTKAIKASHFVGDAEKEAKQVAIAKMQSELNKFIATLNK